MPHFQVPVHEEELDGNVEGRQARSLTEALVQVCGERARSMAVAEIFGIPRHRWGVGGVLGGVHAPVVSLHVREAALHLPGIDDAPGQLSRAIADAVVGAFGEAIRDHIGVQLIGVPTGRSGVGEGRPSGAHLTGNARQGAASA